MDTAYDCKPLEEGDTVYEVHPCGMTVSEILPKEEACLETFTVKVEDSDDEYKPSALTHEPFYRFPPMANLNYFSDEEQINYIKQETNEAFDAYNEWEAKCDIPYSVQRVMGSDAINLKMAYGMELMEVIHAAETALRMEFTSEEAVELWKAVEKKNRRRGYYQEGD